MKAVSPMLRHAPEAGGCVTKGRLRSGRRHSTVARAWWRRKPEVLETDPMEGVKTGLDSVDDALVRRYAAKGQDPFVRTNRPVPPPPTRPPEHMELAPHMSRPVCNGPPKVDPSQAFAPLDVPGTNQATKSEASPTFDHYNTPDTVESEELEPSKEVQEQRYSREVPQTEIPQYFSPLNAPFEAYCLLSAAVFGAIRLGRNGADDDRQLSLHLTNDIIDERIRASRESQRATAEASAQDVNRIRDATAKAAIDVKAREKKQAEYAKVLAEEAAKLKSRQESAKVQYEDEEKRKAEELAARLKTERKLAEERKAERDAQEIEREAARVQAERDAAAARAQQVEAERLAREAELQREANEREALSKQRKVFAAHAQGRVVIGRAPKGCMTQGKFPLPATLQMAVETESLLRPEENSRVSRGVDNLGEARALTGVVAGPSARALATAQADEFRLQAAGGRGPAVMMTDTELQFWMYQLCMHTHVSAICALRKSCDAFQSKPSTTTHNYSVRLEYGCLPQDNPRRSTALLDASLAATIASDAESQASALPDALDTIYEDDCSVFSNAFTPEVEDSVSCGHLLEIALSAYAIDHFAATTHEASDADLVRRAVCRWLDKRIGFVEPDTLLDTAEVTSWSLGDEHPIAKHVSRLAESNMSIATKQAIMNRQAAIETRIAEAIIKEERLSAAALAADRSANKEKMTPAPERAWALRNVAASSAATMGASGRKRAKAYLETSLVLMRTHYGDAQHPGLIGELWGLTKILVTNEEWYPEAVPLMEELIEIVSGLVTKYKVQGDLLSATAVAEGTCHSLDGLMDPSNHALGRLAKQGESLLSLLDTPDADQVLKLRKQVNTLDRLAEMYTEMLEVRADSVKVNRNELWRLKKPLLPFYDT